MYKISEFAKMSGLPQSKVRFYEKNGLLKVRKDINGYRYFTRWDAFRVNAFRVLLQYGFTVEKAISMLDERQSGELFVNSLEDKKEELQKQIDLMHSRMKKLEAVISLLKEGYENKFEIVDMEDYLYVLASNGIDFGISVENGNVIAQFAELLSITSYARIIMMDELLNRNVTINPSYASAIPISREHLLGKYDKSKVKKLKLGKCIRYYRNETREGSEKLDSFNELFNFLEKNNYKINGDVLLLPTFLNLDGKGIDIEVLYVPIKN
ncbi:MerR family transcriptional regulator [Sedimentibacter saalensis]|uniref:DNA-binding transcriptional MerR regulator n=2 Tax=Sedimentibacter saalensis TaxID=130788 RepID=A0A562J407_9FIRM|nr:MerR family transcriptional regulator [Sedimentibacter saalensis]TWH77916.1 DNA-binding transcriptional MerR regulator [Sedimentibacter saalensis]